MGVKLQSALGGSVELNAPSTASNFAMTVPAGDGQLYTNQTILGTVSQSNGVPTGSIIERGSNANGDFVKYADGTMICTLRVNSTTNLTTGTGSIFRTGSNGWTFPHAFSTIANLTCTGNQGLSPGFAWLGEGSGGVSVTGWSWSMFSSASSTATPTASLIAIGRWA